MRLVAWNCNMALPRKLAALRSLRADVAVIDQPRASEGITLGENVWLGAGAKVLDGVTLGSNVVVGANGVVTSNLPDGAIAAGVPARILRTREANEFSES